MGSHFQLLLAEGDADMRLLLARALEELSVEVCPVEDRAAAVGALEERDFGLVVSDLDLGDGDGLSLIGFLRSRGKETPVVLMSAFGGAHASRRVLESGGLAYLDKPFDLAELIDLVRAAVERSA